VAAGAAGCHPRRRDPRCPAVARRPTVPDVSGVGRFGQPADPSMRCADVDGG